jgi:hypothetical protein
VQLISGTEARRRQWGHWPTQRFENFFYSMCCSFIYWLDRIHLHTTPQRTCYTFLMGNANPMTLVILLNMINIKYIKDI